MPKIFIASAANTLAPALSVLQELGFAVSRVPDSESLLRADNGHIELVAEDTLLLLGLASLALHRGASWEPTDAEVDAVLRLHNISDD